MDFIRCHIKNIVQAFFICQLILFGAVKLLAEEHHFSSPDGENAPNKKLDILYAVNCGGDEHIDHFGVPYAADPNRDGIVSDYGQRWTVITNAHPDDFILYQTERYSESTFGYTIPLPKSTNPQNYVLVLKFCEVYFNQAGMKVFDVLLNGDHLIVDGLDIFERAGGRAAAYDIHVPFRIANNKLILLNTGEESDFTGSLRIDFVKTSQDNPKCNAFYIARGNLEDIPKFEVQKSVTEEPDLDEFDTVDDHNHWTGPEFPGPAGEEDEIGFDRYYPVVGVFAFIAVITFFLFKL